MRFITNSRGSSASKKPLPGGCWAAGAKLNEGCHLSGESDRTSSLAAGDGLAVVMSRTSRGSLIGDVFEGSSFTLLGIRLRFISSAVRGVGAFVTRSD